MNPFTHVDENKEKDFDKIYLDHECEDVFI